jgi:hypothetical protein
MFNTAYIVRPIEGMWIVGFFYPNGDFHRHAAYQTKDEAEKQVHSLNGGDSQTVAVSGAGDSVAVPGEPGSVPNPRR